MTSTTTRWWWIRHAPVADGEGIVYGQRDMEIELPDPAFIEKIAARLPGGAIWITSNLKRTKHTAALFSGIHPGSANPIIEPEFAEMHFGDWEGVARKDIPPETMNEFRDNIVDVAPPNGESFQTVVDRVVRMIAIRTEEFAGRDIVSVGHTGSIKAALTLANDLKPETALAFVTAPLCVPRLDCHCDETAPQWAVAMVNVNYSE
ncbi:MAG: histidine phosphatase family protein [Proteobacteria bacterium]|nr:histidine phosphatase family protein [Pseudomonadota bacterium]